jgi:hypothetical protein
VIRVNAKLHAAAWAVGSALITTLWVVSEWQDVGALRSFGHEGDPGQWNPTLWAIAVGGWGLFVGIKALGAYVRDRVRFHVAAWALGLVVLTPLWALIEWQDNGRFERFSRSSQPGSWEPWILYVLGGWALAIVLIALWEHRGGRPHTTSP